MIKNNKGFTLVEALVVVTVIGIVGVILTDLLFRSFRGSNKTQIQGILQENGGSALNLMDQAIRYSKVICAQSDAVGSIITVRTREAKVMRFMMVYQTSDNGYISQDFPKAVSTGQDRDYCDRSTGIVFTDTLNQPVNLTEKVAPPGVSVRPGGLFSWNSGTAKDVVTVQFTLGPGKDAGLNYDTQNVDIPFETSIVLR